jgi:hypothetical protein
MRRFAIAAAAVVLLSMPVVSPARAADSVTNFIAKWDPDHDGTLDKSEYESIVAQRFHAANRDNDTTIEANELRTRAGRALLKLLN